MRPRRRNFFTQNQTPVMRELARALFHGRRKQIADAYLSLPLRAPRPAPVGTKAERRVARLEARQKVYRHLPPRSEREKPQEPGKRRGGLFLPVFGKTMHDPGMGSTFHQFGGLSTHRPSRKSRRRKDPVGCQRRERRLRRVERREQSLAKLIVERDLCKHGDHDFQTVTLADGRSYDRCVRYQCGHQTIVS